MKLISKFRKHLFIAGLMVSMFALNAVSAFAQATPVPPPTTTEVVTDVMSFVESSSMMIFVFAGILLGLMYFMLRRFVKGLR